MITDFNLLVIKCVHMALIGIATFILGSFVSINLDNLLFDNSTDEEELDKLSTFQIIYEILLFVSLIYVFHYFIRNILTDYYNPYVVSGLLSGAKDINYDIERIKSVSGGGVIMAFAILNFADKFKIKSKYLISKRLTFFNLKNII